MPNFIHAYGWLAKKITATFRPSRKTSETVLFRLKNSHLTKFAVKCTAKSASHLSHKKWKTLFTTTVN